MNTDKLLNKALNGLDMIGYELEARGITDKVNRHNIIAFIMAEQKHFEGEFDSWTSKYDTQKARVERVVRKAESLAENGVNLVTGPFKSTLHQVRSKIS